MLKNLSLPVRARRVFHLSVGQAEQYRSSPNTLRPQGLLSSALREDQCIPVRLLSLISQRTCADKNSRS